MKYLKLAVANLAYLFPLVFLTIVFVLQDLSKMSRERKNIVHGRPKLHFLAKTAAPSTMK